MNPVVIVAIALASFELISFILSFRSFANFLKQLDLFRKFENPWGVVTPALWLILAILSIEYSRNISPISYTYLSIGVSTFLLEVFRYHYLFINFLHKKFKAIRPVLVRYYWDKLEPFTFNIGFTGCWFSIVGISLICKSFTFFAAFLYSH